MRVHFIDVGQGASTLFEFPHDAVLVDTGGELNAYIDSTEELTSYLDAFFARRTDLHNQLTSLFITHPHLDHTRGIQAVVERYKPQNIITNGQTFGSGKDQQIWLLDYAAAHASGPNAIHLRDVYLAQIPARGLSDDVIDSIHGVDVDPSLTVLWGQVESDPGWGEAYDRPRFQNNNNHCLVLRVDFGHTSVLVTGDLEEYAIRDLVKKYGTSNLLDVDVYEVGHHGSINATTNEFLAAMTPKYAVIEMGHLDHQADYSAWAFGHPRREIVQMLEAAIPTSRGPIEVQVGIRAKEFETRVISKAIYATGWDGTVVLEADADGSIGVVKPANARGQGTPEATARRSAERN